MPNKSEYNLAFRPDSYFEVYDVAKELVSRIKGTVRRNWIVQLIECEELRGKDGIEIPEWMLKELLTDEERLAFGSVHPSFMSGEYLPPLEPYEVEIAEVSLKSTMGDVISLRAQRRGDAIRYRIVDEHYDAPVQKFKLSPQETVLPLTMGELIQLMDGAEDEMNAGFGRGLTNSYRNFYFDAGELETLANFVTVSSRFYPQLAAYYDEEAKEWLKTSKKKYRDDDEDTIDPPRNRKARIMDSALAQLHTEFAWREMGNSGEMKRDASQVFVRVHVMEDKCRDDRNKLELLLHLRRCLVEEIGRTGSPPPDEIVERLFQLIEEDRLMKASVLTPNVAEVRGYMAGQKESDRVAEELEDRLADDEDSEGEDEGAFTCTFCGSQDNECEHVLGSRDLHFCGDFEVDGDGGPLNELSALFYELGEAVATFLQAAEKAGINAGNSTSNKTGKKAGKKSGIKAGKVSGIALKPQRLRDLVQAVAGGNNNGGFTEYVEQVAKDTKVLVEAESHEERGAPGFCSIVRMYWAKDVPAALAGMQLLVNEDIRHLRRPA